jgi:hypothetical protein
MIDPGANDKIEKLLKVALSSDKEGEVVAAARAIRRTLDGAGSDIHELAARLKGGKLSKAEMQRIYDAGVQDGKDAAAASAGFTSTEGPTYLEMANYCDEHDNGRLTPREREFINDMTRWYVRREPTEKQAKWLHLLWVRLGRRR